MWMWVKAHQEILGWTALASFLMVFAMLIAVPLVLIWLPKDYMVYEESRTPPRFSPARWPYLILKNILGAILAAAGLAMLILPGQGLLTLAVGISLLDIPGKRTLVRRIICRPRILRMINWLRAKAAKPPLETASCDEPRRRHLAA